MSRGEAWAQAVHAALRAFDVPHGRVVMVTGQEPTWRFSQNCSKPQLPAPLEW